MALLDRRSAGHLLLFIYVALLVPTKAEKDTFLFSKEKNTDSPTYPDIWNEVPLESETSVPSSQDYFYIPEFFTEYEEWETCWVDFSTTDDYVRVPINSVHEHGLEVPLPFLFPYWGYLIQNVTVMSKGYLTINKTSDNKIEAYHSFISPYMRKSFDTTSNDSSILYSVNGSSFTVQWENMRWKDLDPSEYFNFQVTLFSDGRIYFSYKEVPALLRLFPPSQILSQISLSFNIVPIKQDAENSWNLDLNYLKLSDYFCIRISPSSKFLYGQLENEDLEFEPHENVRFVRQAIDRMSNTNSETLDEFKDYSDVTPAQADPREVLHDHHNYYNSSVYTESSKWEAMWMDLDSDHNKNVHIMLSNSYRKGVTIPLSFDFPFYGHSIRNITITTGGFLFTGTQVHSWLAATQYIAPLMANFDPSLQNSSIVKFIDNGTAFTVQWENVLLKDKTHAGNFTFQVTLKNSGDIAFVYKQIPLSVININDDDHPVKVGLSDAYIIDRTIFFTRRKTIYEYHRVDLKKPVIANKTSIYFTALPTCVALKDCYSCMKGVVGFECGWCSDRCSDGIDRRRQEWILQGCGLQKDLQQCPYTPTPIDDIKTLSSQGDRSTMTSLSGISSTLSGISSTLSSFISTTNFSTTTQMTLPFENISSTSKTDKPVAIFDEPHAVSSKNTGDVDHLTLGPAGIIGVLFIIAMIIVFAIWIFYAYRNPHSASGQFLIKYRPNQWHWHRTEARYTAAAVNM